MLHVWRQYLQNVAHVVWVGYYVSDLTVMSEENRDRVLIGQRSHLVLIYCLQLSCRNCTAANQSRINQSHLLRRQLPMIIGAVQET